MSKTGLLHLAVALLASVPSYGQRQDVAGLDKLRVELDGRDASFQNAKFRVTYSDRTRKGLMRGAPFIKKVQVVDVILDLSQGPVTTNRARVEVLETPDPELAPRLAGHPEWVRYFANLTPAGARYLETATDAKTQLGYIWDRGLPWMVHPSELLTLNYWSPGHILFREDTIANLVGTDTIAGYETIHVSWEVVGSDTSVDPPLGFYRGSFWIVPTLDYAVIRSEIERKPRRSAPWKLVRRIDTGRYTKVDDLWAPGEAKLDDYTYYDKDLGHELRKQTIASFEKWELNRSFPDSVYDLEFPAGTVVRDFTRGDVTYTKGQIGDPDIRALVDHAREMELASSHTPKVDAIEQFNRASREDPFTNSERDSWKSWSIAAILGIIVLFVGIAVWTTHRRRIPRS